MTPETRPDRLNEETTRLGKALVTALFVLFKSSMHYPEGHAALSGPVGKLLRIVRELEHIGEESTLRVRGSHLYLGEMHLRLDVNGFEAARYVMEELTAYRVGGITFSNDTGPQDLERFIYAFREIEEDGTADRYVCLLHRTQKRQVSNIEVESFHEEPERIEFDRDKHRDHRLKARLLYDRALAEIEEIMARASAGQPLRLKEARRIVQRMIDLLSQSEPSLLGLATMGRGPGNGLSHAINVCILSLSVGRRLGMSKFHLCELGIAALLHDIGEVAFPPELLEREEALSPEEQRALENHPIIGVKKIMESKTIDTTLMRVLACVFEHHLQRDYSGYPRTSYRRFSLPSRVLAVADRYDVITSPRFQDGPIPRDQAIRQLLSEEGPSCDIPIVKLLADAVGLHCIGSLLLLDSRELAVVVEQSPDRSRFDSPLVKIIADAQGVEVDGELVDLSDSGNQRMVMADLDPFAFGLDVSRYLQ